MTTHVPQPLTKVGGEPRIKALRRFAVSISALTLLGHVILGFEQAPITPLVCLGVAYSLEGALEMLDAYAHGRRPSFIGKGAAGTVDFFLPAHITALACAMLLFANHNLVPYVLATVVAVGSKYLIKAPVGGRWRHVMNPSNLGIVTVLILFPGVGIAPPYEFTENISGPLDWLVPAGVLVLGTMLNVKLTKRWPLIVGWVAAFIAQDAARALLQHSSFVGGLAPLTGTAFILFTNYMITDPATTPNKPLPQVVFGMIAASAYGVLVGFGVSFGLFFALVITCALRGLWLAIVAVVVRTTATDARTAATVPVPATGATS